MRLASVWLASLIVAMAAGTAMAWQEESIVRDGLGGTMIRPDHRAKPVTVLILAGSGPVDRDGNLPNMRNDSLKRLAQGLADLGIASLRIDKRGVGESRGMALREEDLRIGTYVDDAVAWLAYLRARPDGGAIFILGHSEGALIATLAAQKADVGGLVLIAGAGEPAAQVIARQLAAAGVSEAVQAASRTISDSLMRGVPVGDVPPDLMMLYRPSVQPYLMSWLGLDPSAELARVACPVLIVQGTTDLQVTVDDARRLEAARPGARLILMPGMNHVLRAAPAERAENLQTYAMSDKPLAGDLLPAIAAFLKAPAP